MTSEPATTLSTDGAPAGIEVGSRRVLHPGPLRWLRALAWGLLLFMVFMLIDAGVTLGPAHLLRGESGVGRALITALLSGLALALYAGVVRLAEGRRPAELGLRPAAVELVAGLVLGALMLSAVVALLVAFGLYDVSGPRSASPWGMVSIAISSGVLEELIMRAIVLRLTMRAFGLWPALLFQAALFGLLHLANPNASPVAAAAIALEAGLMLAGFYLLTGRIWISIGVHAAWNFTQGWVWGAAVSGVGMSQSLFVSAPKPGAPEALTGGAFGPEASVPAMVVGTTVAAATLYLAWRRGKLTIRAEETLPGSGGPAAGAGTPA